MTICKRMSFKLVSNLSGNDKILSCFSHGKIILKNTSDMPCSLNNIMFNANLNCGYEKEISVLKEALHSVVTDCSEKNANKVLEILKQTTKLSNWIVFEFDKEVNVKIKEKLHKPFKKMSFKLVSNFYDNDKILSCFSHGKIILKNTSDMPYSLNNIMFNSNLNCGYKKEISVLKEALRSVVTDCSEKNAYKVLAVLKQTTKLSNWIVFEFDEEVNVKEKLFIR